MNGFEMSNEEAAAACVAGDPAFAALDASGAPIIAAAGTPLRAVYANASARAAFGAKAGERLLEADAANGRRLVDLVESVRAGAAPRLERLRFSLGGAAQMATILCRRLGGGAAPEFFVIAALGVRAARANAASPAPASAAAAPPETEAAPLRARLLARHGVHPPRFLWKTDAAGRFVHVTHVLADVAGGDSADILGRTIGEVAERFVLGGQLPRAFFSGKSWSGIEVEWPLERAGERAPVVFGGMPAFDAQRRFAGYQGYGVFHLSRAVLRPAAATPAHRDAPEQPPVFSSDNVVPLRPLNGPRAEAPQAAEPTPVEEPALTPTERNAFDEIARALAEAAQPPAAQISARELLDRVERAVEAGGEEARAARETSEMAALLDRLPVGVLVSRGEAALYANRTLLDYLGYADVKSLEADRIPRLFHVRADGLAEGAPIALPAKDGEALEVDAHAQSVDWGGGPATLVTLRRHRAVTGEQLQREVPSPPAPGPRAALEATSDALALVGPDGAIEQASAAFSARFGAQPEALRGRALESLFPKAPAILPAASEALEAARREAERASAAKSEFLARVSHEIRTPLSAIIGFAEVMMEERFGPIGSERYKEYLKDVHASGEHVLSLVNDLLDLSKIEAGKLELEFERVDVNAVISECVSIMHPQANQARVVMRLALAPSLPRLRADLRSLKQIMLNLLSNAVKFNEAGGQVIVSTALLESGHVVVRVKDTGVGMDETDIATALEPFGQAGAARGAGKGTGLGLPVTKALIEANHASFTIKSRRQEGTLIEVAFPPPQVLAAE